MKITVIGGGPAGLFFSILARKHLPGVEVRIFERNGPQDTFGWGVVFSDATMSNIEEADPESFEEIRRNFAYWDDIETYYRNECVTSTGHGFCGLSRQKLLGILQERALSLGVEVRFEEEIDSLDSHLEADLLVAADGVNSMVRDRFADHFKPTLDWRKCRFCWLGTTLPLDAFTFVFRENEHGLWRVHAYPFESGLSTWIVECRAETLEKSGLENADEAATVAYCEKLFAGDLKGHPLLTNMSVWRTFPTVCNETWHHENVVLIGDAAHTAHFSIGSGTKLAMEDSIALVDSLKNNDHIPAALQAYEDNRYVDVIKTQKAAQTSLEWFEKTERYTVQEPIPFTFNLMTRSKQITYDNLELRDPEFVARSSEWYRQSQGAPLASDGSTPPPMFTPYTLRGMALPNRVVVSPMCQYSAHDGLVGDWHFVHLASRAMGGAGLVITEMTNVEDRGRITQGCAGLYSDEHVAAWKRIVDFVHEHSKSKIGIQLAHSGRKGSTHHPWEGDDEPLAAEDGAWDTIGPSPLPFNEGWPAPREMDRKEMDRIRDLFVRSTEMSLEAGFDMIEVHMAHGYLLSSYISPLANHRQDEYGGSLENRARYPLEVFKAMRQKWPEERPMSVRISATDWVGREGMTPEDAVILSRWLKEAGCDIIDVSSGGNSPTAKPEYGRMYQVPTAEKIRYEADIPVMAVGAIQGEDHCNTILLAGRADLCAMARPHLGDAYLSLRASEKYGYPDQFWPGQYVLGRKARKKD